MFSNNPLEGFFGKGYFRDRDKIITGLEKPSFDVELNIYDGLIVPFTIEVKKKQGKFVPAKPKEVDRLVTKKIVEVLGNNSGYEFDKNVQDPSSAAVIKWTLYFRKVEPETS